MKHLLHLVVENGGAHWLLIFNPTTAEMIHSQPLAMDALAAFMQADLDVLLAGPGRLVNVAAVPAAAIYQVVRAPAPEPGADLMAELWAGNTLEAIELPLTWLDGDQESAVPPDQDALL